MNDYNERLKTLMDEYAHSVYHVSKKFPKEEQFGVTSQIRRASLSVILNFIEGYARRREGHNKIFKNFLDISFGSLKESKYLLHFTLKEKYLNKEDYDKLIILSDEIGAMLYKIKN